MLLIAVEQCLLFREIHKPHASAFESERRKLLLGKFKEDVDDGIPQSAELEFFHGVEMILRLTWRDSEIFGCAVRTAERCWEISQGYAFFAYPWMTSRTQEPHPEGVSRIPRTFSRVRLFLVSDNRGLRSLRSLNPRLIS